MPASTARPLEATAVLLQRERVWARVSRVAGFAMAAAGGLDEWLLIVAGASLDIDNVTP